MPGAHSQLKSKGPGRRLLTFVLPVVVLVMVVGGVAGVVLLRSGGGRAAASPTSNPDPAPSAFLVQSISPDAGATQVPSDAPIEVRFTDPLSAQSPTPSLTPPVAGSWQEVTPTTFAFVATAPLVPSSSETVTVPGGSGGIESSTGKRLRDAATAQFSVATGSELRLQQLLSQLGYLPLNFVPARPLTSPVEAADPQQGAFEWRSNEPASLSAQWTVGSSNVITTGAIMAFESNHNLTTDGAAGPQVWAQLLASAAAGTVNTAPYNYVYVSKGSPETATVYSNGAAVYSTKVNTGVAAAPTASGTFPVYERFRVTTMTGTNPDGSHYSDPGIPWVSYFNGGDALHGFVRSSYGFPQSDGCVEMPIANAAVVWPLTPIGTLVTVS
jgi:peptidoglycan hydrolase-like protein with peptidoglycan-binding domain